MGQIPNKQRWLVQNQEHSMQSWLCRSTSAVLLSGNASPQRYAQPLCSLSYLETQICFFISCISLLLWSIVPLSECSVIKDDRDYSELYFALLFQTSGPSGVSITSSQIPSHRGTWGSCPTLGIASRDGDGGSPGEVLM